MHRTGQLQVESLGERRVLHQRQVQVFEARPDGHIAAQIPELERHPVGSLNNEHVAALTGKAGVLTVGDVSRAPVGGRAEAGDQWSGDVRPERSHARK